MLFKRFVSLALASALLGACSAGAPRPDAPASGSASVPHENLNATLWLQTASEYEAAVRGTFAAATRQLDAALADRAWTALPLGERREGFESKPPAIIVDADETMIDNSPFQARAVRDGGGFAYERWLAWVNERRARALPGALEFANYASSRGVTIHFVSNRDAPAETESTIANLRSLGFPVEANGSNVLLRGDPRAPLREKSQRRRLVGEKYRVLLLLGDNLGDFVDIADADAAARKTVVEQYGPWWGERWFMLPNPSYGSWESTLLRACGESGQTDPIGCKRQSLRIE
jgi:5'-nucleotidase (lipoprotein e(P4) family)